MPLACAGNHASIAASSVLPNVAYPDAWIAAAMSRCSQILLSAIASLWLSMPSFADSLVLHGSNTIGEKLAPNLVISWLESRGCKLLERKSPVLDHLVLHAECAGKPFQVDIHAYGTGTGFAELLAERADLWMASRPANADEVSRASKLARLDQAPFENVIALDGLSVIVHPGQLVRRMDLVQLQRVFSGQIQNWQALGGPDKPINVYARDEKSGTFDSFKSMVLAGAALRPDAKRFESSEQLSNSVQSDPNGIGFVGLAAVGKARPLAIADGAVAAQLPSMASVVVEDYALSRRLYLYCGPQLSALGHEFLAFVGSDSGQTIVDQTGFIGLRLRNLPHADYVGAPEEYREDIVRDAARLGVNVRFEERRSDFDARAVRDMERLIDYLKLPENRGKRLRVAGFADTREIPILALNLSIERADFVAQYLGRRGVVVERSRGFGAVLPIASNDNDRGRGRNRRVEVWIVDGAPRVSSTATAKTVRGS